MKLLRLAVAVATLACAICRGDNIISLNKDTFSSYVNGPRKLFVNFYAPWSGHCTRLAPEYAAAADALAGDKNYVVAQVNCEEESDLCRANDIPVYPSMILFHSNKKATYQGIHKKDAILEWLATDPIAKVIVEDSLITELTSDSINDFITEGAPYRNAGVFFYSPVCPNCKKAWPEYYNVARAFARDKKNITFGKMNCDMYYDVCLKFSVATYPMLLIFKNDVNKVSKFNNRNAKDIVELIDKEMGLFRNVDGSLNEKAGRYWKLDNFAKEFITFKNSRDNIRKMCKDVEWEHLNIYVKYMEKIDKFETFQEADAYPKKEVERLNKIISSGKVSDEKLDKLIISRNIISSFIVR